MGLDGDGDLLPEETDNLLHDGDENLLLRRVGGGGRSAERDDWVCLDDRDVVGPSGVPPPGPPYPKTPDPRRESGRERLGETGRHCHTHVYARTHMDTPHRVFQWGPPPYYSPFHTGGEKACK